MEGGQEKISADRTCYRNLRMPGNELYSLSKGGFQRYVTLLFLICRLCSAGSLLHAQGPGHIQPFITKGDSGISYHVTIHYPGKHYSGLLYVRNTGHAAFHLLLMSELGMTLLESEITADSAHMVYCFDPLKQSGTIRFINRHLFFLTHPFTESGENIRKVKRKRICYTFVHPSYRCVTDSAGRIIAAHAGKGLSAINLHYEYNRGNVPHKIVIKQRWIRMKWKLSILEKI